MQDLIAPTASAIDNDRMVPEENSEIREAWRVGLRRLALAWLAIMLLYPRDVFDMVSIWWNVSTYNHILVIPPVIAWLVAQRRDQLAQLRPQPWLWGLAPLAGASLFWILGDAADANIVRQFALVAMLQSSVLAVLGHRIARAMLFPLAYGLFLVPFGEELVPHLQLLTADMAMALLDVSGVPAHLQGVFITTPTGYFEVAEACSGVKFLIAMTAFGVLVANVCFLSWRRRIAFVALSIVVPILANGVRAWGTIYIASVRGNDFAAGFDHVFYGWFFFAAVLALTLGLGWRFFDRAPGAAMLGSHLMVCLATPDTTSQPYRWALPFGLSLCLCVPALWELAGNTPPAPIAESIVAPDIPGWKTITNTDRHPWRPRADGANARRRIAYGRGDDRVDLFVALYDGQGEGREITGFGQGAIDPDGDWAWTEPGRAIENGKAERLTAPGPVVREALTFYAIGDMVTGDAVMVKLETLKAQLLHRPQRAAIIIVSAEARKGVPARAAIDRFLGAAPPVAKLADQLLKPR